MPGSPTTLDHRSTCAHTPLHVAFRILKCVDIRNNNPIVARWLACGLLCRRFSTALTYDTARLEASVVRCTFTAVDLHWFLAGLPAHPIGMLLPLLNHTLVTLAERVLEIQQPNHQLDCKRPATPSPPGSPNSEFVSTPNDVDTNSLQFLLNSASAYACPAVGQ